MTRQKIIEFCLAFPAAYEDYPFDGITDDGAWTVMRHRSNKKSFAFIYERNGKLCLNLKCDPFEADFLRQAMYYAGVPHEQNTLKIPSSSAATCRMMSYWRMIERSYDLIKPKIKNEKDKLL